MDPDGEVVPGPLGGGHHRRPAPVVEGVEESESSGEPVPWLIAAVPRGPVRIRTTSGTAIAACAAGPGAPGRRILGPRTDLGPSGSSHLGIPNHGTNLVQFNG